MDETTTTAMSDWPEDVQKTADVIGMIVKSKHAEHERAYQAGRYSEPVPLEDIHFGVDNFEPCLNIMQGIAPYQDWKKTAESMLGTLSWKYGEIESSHRQYRLVKSGLLYRHIKQELSRKQ